MDENASGQLQFQGQDAAECEGFMTAIVRRAFAQGKQRDDEWMADFAATCMVNDAMRWWGALDEDVQRSWKLLRRAMLSRYRPMFHGGSGEAVEKFIRAVCDKAIDEGKQEDNKWIVTYASSCLAGEALRWYAHLDSGTQENWKKLQQALLIQYPRGVTAGPAPHLVPTPPVALSLAPRPKPTRRGRIRFSEDCCSFHHYISKHLSSDNRVLATSSRSDALVLEWSTGSDGLQKLFIPDSQIRGYDVLGMKWLWPDSQRSNNFLTVCAVNSETKSTACGFLGDVVIDTWKISSEAWGGDIFTVSAVIGQRKLSPRWNTSTNLIWLSDTNSDAKYLAEMFFDPVH